MNALEIVAWVYATVAVLVATVGAVGWETEPARNRRARRRYARTALLAPIWPVLLPVAARLAAIKGTAAIRGMWQDAFRN